MRKIVIISVILLSLFYIEYSSRKHNYYNNGPENAIYYEPDQGLAVNGNWPTLTFGEEIDTGISFVVGGVEVLRFTDGDSEPTLAFGPVTGGFYKAADGRIHWIEAEED
ncbi:hypothetical protein LCGC14_1200320 [marine sediment metagenome]|uniref:Uncharacterized protein n=1 Tax=marine sediment metagenome TaxID=412755 RepID=A0A0F9NZH5_9ZZZZ|nr:hypothetical protein [Candidatus Aminicenantes bacterium]